MRMNNLKHGDLVKCRATTEYLELRGLRLGEIYTVFVAPEENTQKLITGITVGEGALFITLFVGDNRMPRAGFFRKVIKQGAK